MDIVFSSVKQHQILISSLSFFGFEHKHAYMKKGPNSMQIHFTSHACEYSSVRCLLAGFLNGHTRM